MYSAKKFWITNRNFSSVIVNVEVMNEILEVSGGFLIYVGEVKDERIRKKKTEIIIPLIIQFFSYYERIDYSLG